MPSVIFSDIETNAITALKTALAAANLPVQEVDLQENPPGISRTAVHCLVSDVSFRELTMTKFKATATLSVVIFVKDVKNEATRRQGAYPVVMGCLGILCNADLGLNITKLAPSRLFNITPAKWKDAGIIVFQLDFKTSFNVSADELDGNAVDLLTVAAQYFLNPANETGTPDASDTIVLQTPPEGE
jgi:hypothetical protein